MIIDKIRIQEEKPMQGATKTWPLPICDLNVDSSAGQNGYLVRAAEGLGPPDFAAVVEGFDISGIPVMSSNPQKRDLAFRITLAPKIGQTYGDMRDDLYKLISRTVLVKFMKGSTVLAQTTGFIRQFEAAHFTNLPEVQLVIECQEGAFAAPKATNIPLASLVTLNPIINYDDGTAPTGLDLKIKVIAARNTFSITEHSKLWAVGGVDVHNKFEINWALFPDDQITISTYPRNRRVTMFRPSSGVTVDMAGSLNAGAVWPKLYSGVNTFTWTFDSNWTTWLSASYVPRFWGV